MATTICNAGSGDLCDPDESCPGTAGGGCPADTISAATTICRTGSGDICDPDESCTGVADAACPTDAFEAATTICNAGSGDLCDPDESCPGTAGGGCPADTIAAATTICRTGSGDICDPDESCPGVADGGCPADFVEPATTVCNAGGICDPSESCPGTAAGGCPPDVTDPPGTPCNDGDECTFDDVCTGGQCVGGDGEFLVIDEDSIDNGSPPNFFDDLVGFGASGADVNDDIAEISRRNQLRYFAANPGLVISLYTGEFMDEGWFSVPTILQSWVDTGPTPSGSRNFLGNPSQPFTHNVGPGLGTPDTNGDRESLLDKIPDVTPIREAGLEALIDETICAVVYDSDVSINYDPLNGSLKGANLGTVAFKLLSTTPLAGLPGFSSTDLPETEIRILDSEDICECPLGDELELPQPVNVNLSVDPNPAGPLLTWVEPVTTQTVSSYRIHRAEAVGNQDPMFKLIDELPAPSTSYVDSGALSSVDYYYRVEAVVLP